jgi:NitT/TauT family transport system ATP-binding protein/nitrate/nitrite transport system substrate-binding protein
LALAMAGGLRGKRTGLCVPMGLSRGGNAIVAGFGASGTIVAEGLAAWVRACPAPPRLAVVHVFSTHNLLLRAWLAASGVDPDREVEIVAVPPALVVADLAAGRIDGFCAGAPWGQVAVEAGVGQVLTGSSAIRPGHPEKCLALRADFASARLRDTAALMRALVRAQELCADPARAPALAALLAARLSLPEAAVRLSLPGGAAAECIGFADAAAVSPADGVWFLQQMGRWGWLDPSMDVPALAEAVYRPVVAERL